MDDFKLEHTEPDKVYETADTIKEKEPQFIYYEIEVSRKQLARVEVRVPADKPIDWKNVQKIAEAAVAHCLSDYDWERDFSGFIEVENFKQVPEIDVTEYDVYQVR